MNIYFNDDVPSGIEKEFLRSLIGWYPFTPRTEALLLTGGIDGEEILADELSRKKVETTCVSAEIIETAPTDKKYDYIIGCCVLERVGDPEALLRGLFKHLKSGGHMLIGTDNRMGLKYFCGDKDMFTGKCMDGPSGYVDGGTGRDGRAYTRTELRSMAERAGCGHIRFYSIIPAIWNPRLLYAEEFMPEEKLDARMVPEYSSPDTVFLDEVRLYDTMIEEKLFHAMANGYLLEITADAPFMDVLTVTSSIDRGKKLAMYTVIRGDGKVEKYPAYTEGEDHFKNIAVNHDRLRSRGIRVLEEELQDGAYVIPYVNAPTATEYFRELFMTDMERFTDSMDRWMDLIGQSSEYVPYDEVEWETFDPGIRDGRTPEEELGVDYKALAYGDGDEQADIGPVARHGYIDLVCINCFIIDGDFVFYDQEFSFDNLPLNVIKIRTLDLLYTSEMERVMPKDVWLRRYGLYKHRNLWRRYAETFFLCLRNQRLLSGYNGRHLLAGRSPAANRRRMNLPAAEYDRLFTGFFKETEIKQVYIFGSGRYAQKFLNGNNGRYEVIGILDNDEHRQGEKLDDISICTPDILREEKQTSEVNVIICVAAYEPILTQLRESGIENIGIFRP